MIPQMLDPLLKSYQERIKKNLKLMKQINKQKCYVRFLQIS